MQEGSRNQLGNTRNPHQTDAKRVLCVCSAGMLRSPSLANMLHKEFGYNTRAAGTEEDFALIPVSEALIVWADEIVFVESRNRQSLIWNLMESKLDRLIPVVQEKAIVLGLPDKYDWMAPELQIAILEQYKEAVDKK